MIFQPNWPNGTSRASRIITCLFSFTCFHSNSTSAVHTARTRFKAEVYNCTSRRTNASTKLPPLSKMSIKANQMLKRKGKTDTRLALSTVQTPSPFFGHEFGSKQVLQDVQYTRPSGSPSASDSSGDAFLSVFGAAYQRKRLCGWNFDDCVQVERDNTFMDDKAQPQVPLESKAFKAQLLQEMSERIKLIPHL